MASAQSCTDRFDLPDSTTCAELACLYTHQEYSAAHSLLLTSAQKCQAADELLLQARILASSSEFVLARYFLNLIEDDSYEKEVRMEYIRISELNDLESNQFPGYLELIDKSSSNNELPFLTDSNHLELLHDIGYLKQSFPRHVEHEGHVFSSEKNHRPSWFNYIEKQGFADIGPSETVGDSLLFLTALNPKAFGFKEAARFEIIAIDIKRNKVLTAFKFDVDATIMHPTVDGNTIYFASNMYGGYGGMDIWKAEILPGGYASPENLGPKINSSANEVFPKYWNEELYFSSDRSFRGFGGLDIYKSSPDRENLELLPFPINTAYDDFGYFHSTQDTSGIFSNRPGGKGGDDVYYVIETRPEQFFIEMIGRIEADGIDLSGTMLEFTKADGSYVGTTTLDAAGYFKLKHVKGEEAYQLRVVDMELPEGSELKLYDEKGGIIKEVQIHSTGVFKFELLAPEDYYLNRKDNEDESVLSLDIGGFVAINEKLEEGLRIYLEDSNGQLIGVSTTNEKGAFEFDAMKPDSKYIIRSEVNNPLAIIRILDSSGNVIQTINPSENNSYVYVRLSDSEQVITITNEMNEEVRVSEKEQFNVPVIQFELDRAALSTESETSLNRVVSLLRKNPNVKIEISGHTDSRGEDRYNLKLSQQRIDAVVAYLVESGIDKSRLTGIGYGEKEIKNKCVDGVECSEAEHAVNRRTEMRVYKNTMN